MGGLLSRACAGLLLGAVLSLCGGRAAALDLRRQYEEELVRWALEQSGLVLESRPAGKIIERVAIVREDIIAASDPYPRFLNYVHIKTRDHVVRQELLVQPGEVWNEELVEESARNLRKLSILAVVRAVPCRGSRPDRVVLLVVTKDLWSIRFNTIFSAVGSTVQKLEMMPTEQNFLGRNKRVSLHLRLQQLALSGFAVHDQIAIGQLYVDERLFGSRLGLTQWFNVVLAGRVPCGGAIGARDDVWCLDAAAGALEGVFALLQLQRPLFALDTRWGFDVYGWVDIQQERRYEPSGQALRTISFQGHPAGRIEIPRVHDREEVVARGSLTRSFRLAVKHELGGGFGGYHSRYAPPQSFPFDESVRSWYAARYLPRSESGFYTFASYRVRGMDFIRVYNVQTFALTEDFALGPDLSLELRLGTTLGAAGLPFGELHLAAQYRWSFGGDLLTVRLAGQTRCQPHVDSPVVGPGAWVNNRLEASVRNVSPRLGIGRLHAQIRSVLRGRDLDQTRSYLGGDSGLRGYPSEAFEGQNLLLVNAEYRTDPINFFTLHLGLVAFYDGGAVFGGPDPRQSGRELELRYHQSLGLGARGHFPQFDKESLRIDIGFPLSGDAGSVGTWISASFGQVF